LRLLNSFAFVVKSFVVHCWVKHLVHWIECHHYCAPWDHDDEWCYIIWWHWNLENVNPDQIKHLKLIKRKIVLNPQVKFTLMNWAHKHVMPHQTRCQIDNGEHSFEPSSCTYKSNNTSVNSRREKFIHVPKSLQRNSANNKALNHKNLKDFKTT
jgi:hypothetical protein